MDANRNFRPLSGLVNLAGVRTRRTALVSALVSVSTLIGAGAAQPVIAAEERIVLEGPQFRCDPQRKCNDVQLEIDRATGEFVVRKGPVVSCQGTATLSEPLGFVSSCENSTIRTRVELNTPDAARFRFRMTKRSGSYQQTVLAVLTETG